MSQEIINFDKLYETILKGQGSTQNAVDKWIESYLGNKQHALIVLLQLFFDSSGCQGKVSEVCEDYTDLIRNLTKEFNEVGSDYPLAQFGIKWKNFKSAFCDFLIRLVKSCQNSIIYDGYMMPNVTSLLAALSDSQVRAFRHTSTLAAMKLMTASIDAYVSVCSQYLTSKRQYEYELKKPLVRKNPSKIAVLLSLIKEEEENLEILNELISFMFKAVFVNRYRDIVPEIRGICISELGLWMKKDPERYLTDLYLKYVGWSLSDKVSDVRKKSLEALKPLYKPGKMLDRLELFTSKFKSRIFSMTRDIDHSVSVEAIALIAHINELFVDTFTDEELNDICKLVYCVNSEVACIAGKFLTTMLYYKINNAVGLNSSSFNIFFIKNLLDFYLESKLHNHVSYLVNSVMESTDTLKDWTCMTDLLLGNMTSVALSPREEMILVEVMVCCIKETCSKYAPVGRVAKKVRSLKMVKELQEDKEKILVHFAVILVDLLDKFKADKEILNNLLEIPQHFDLTVLETYPSLLTNIDSLLFRIPSIVKIYHDTDILEKCCIILDIFSKDKYKGLLKTEVYKGLITDEIVCKFKVSVEEWTVNINNCNKNLQFSLTNSLLKLSVFYCTFDLRNWTLWNALFDYLSVSVNRGIGNHEDSVKHCMVACYFNIFWDLKIINEQSKSGSVSILEQDFKSRLLTYIDVLKKLISDSNNNSCTEEAYIIFCDLLIVLKNSLKSSGFHSFAIGSSQRMLQNYVENHVFSEDHCTDFGESRIKSLYRKRIMLTSYCKLYTYCILPVYFMAHILKHFVTSFSNFGDILKVTILKAKKVDNVDCARAVINAVIMAFEESSHMIKMLNNTYQLNNLFELKELAKRLSAFFSASEGDLIAMHTLHTEGISYAMRNTGLNSDGIFETSHHILFFELLIEFSNKLFKQNKTNILKFLDSKLVLESESDFSKQMHSFFSYKNSLYVTN